MDIVEQVGALTPYYGGGSYLIKDDLIKGEQTLTAKLQGTSLSTFVTQVKNFKGYFSKNKDVNTKDYLFIVFSRKL